MKSTGTRGHVMRIAALEVRTTNARKKQCVTRECRDVVEEIGGAFCSVTRRMQGNELRITEGDPGAVGDRSEGEVSRALSGKPNVDPFSVREQFRPRKVVGVDVSIKYAHEAQSTLLKQANVYIRVD